MQAVFDGHNDVLLRLWQQREEGRRSGRRIHRGNARRAISTCRAPRPAASPAASAPSTSPPAIWCLTSPDADGHYVTPLSRAARARAIARHRPRDGRDRAAARPRRRLEALPHRRPISATAMADGNFAAVLHMEGCEAIDADLAALEVFYAAGLRSLGPVWSRNNIFGHGVPFAFPMIAGHRPRPDRCRLASWCSECNRLGILIDLAHITEKGFWDVAKTTDQPLVASHSNAHALTPVARNLTDRQLDAIRESKRPGRAQLRRHHAARRRRARMPTRRFPTWSATSTTWSSASASIAWRSARTSTAQPIPAGNRRCRRQPEADCRAAGAPDMVTRNLTKICRENWLRVLRSAWHEAACDRRINDISQNRGTDDMMHRKIQRTLPPAAGGRRPFACSCWPARRPSPTRRPTRWSQALAIDDIITHGPGRSLRARRPAEITGNTYDLLVRLDINDTSKVDGRSRRKLDRLRRRPDLHLQAEARPQIRLRQPDHRRGRRLVVRARRQARQEPGLHPHPVRPDRRQRHREGQGRRRRTPSSSPSTSPMRRASCSTA